MSTFCDLPPELVLRICNFLLSCSPASISDAFARPGVSWDEDYNIRQRTWIGWKDVLNLSLTCRGFRTLLHEKHCDVYQTINVHGLDMLWKLFSLLKFLRARPDIAAGAKTLYLNLNPHGATDCMKNFRPSDVELIRREAYEANIEFNEDFWKLPKHCSDSPNNDICRCEECVNFWKTDQDKHYITDYGRTGMVAVLVLHKLKNIRQLGFLFVGGGFFDQLKIGLGLALMMLPKLQALTVGAKGPGSAMHESDAYIATLLGCSATHLHLDDIADNFGPVYRLNDWTPQMFEDITSLTLTGFTFDTGALDEILNEYCHFLTTFKYIPAVYSNCFWSPWTGDCPMPQDIIVALTPKHTESLRTLCIDFTSVWINHPSEIGQDTITTLEDFESLENLWLDCNSICELVESEESNDDEEDDNEANPVIRNLPRSIKKICFVGSLDKIASDLVWLAENHDDFPSLDVVVLESEGADMDIVDMMQDVVSRRPSGLRVEPHDEKRNGIHTWVD